MTSENDLIRRGDALYAIAGWEIPSTAIAALPAVTVGANLQLVRDCRDAVNGEGPRAYDWSDKPHRLIYDLCREIERLAAPDLTPADDAHEAMLEWLSSFPPPNEKLLKARADYEKAIADGRLVTGRHPDPAAIREAAARTLLDMLYMRNGAQNGMTRDDVQRIWDAASSREGYAAVEAFLLALIPTKGGDGRQVYMGQIMAECDCPREAECQAAGRCIAEERK